ncbi:MFS transporter [Xenorhabdus sp. Sc-CR9]|uniref:MFS transporter n=1 Tax=Xenorhabdus sp. Sc-CR9 TaxID=2584468 RepID=UPI001F2EBC84|nr:MFS transporter [Xenorhabdus sp. Sc-CR9]
MSSQRVVLPLFSLTVFFIGATEFMLSPMLKPLSEAFNTTIDEAIWLVSSYVLAYALAAPIFGWLSDRINRRKLLLVSLLFLSLDGLALTIAPNLEIAIGLRILGGIASAALIPTIFALIAEIFPPYKHTSVMGVVMFGMTVGIAAGPILAGILTELFHWKLPFLATTAGGFLLFLISRKYIPSQIYVRKKEHRMDVSQWIRQGKLIRPLVAKGFWNGTTMSTFILAGEVLRQHYELSTGGIGISVSAFGIGLGLGNLSVSMIKHLYIREEKILLLMIVLLFSTISAFMLLPFSLLFSFFCLVLSGVSLGFSAPISTSILVNRAKQNKGQILAVSESLNNLTIFFLLPIATMLLTQHGIAVTMIILGICLITGVGLTLIDILVTESPIHVHERYKHDKK